MIAKLLPILLLVLGVTAGAGAGIFLKPDPKALSADASHAPDAAHSDDSEQASPQGDPTEIVKLNNQFVIPVVDKNMISALVVMSLSVETGVGRSAEVYDREPKLRDVFLQALFDHANRGGFDGEFTQARNMDVLRSALLDVATHVLGDAVLGVLITEIARQDV
ncbi:flagellar FliL protein [Roseovarius sp. MBR-51]